MSEKGKSKPILFSTPMVKAILEGRKSVTRRVIKLKDGYNLEGKGEEITENIKLFGSDTLFYNGEETDEMLKSPYKVGDILYVRETWKEYEKRSLGRLEIEKFYGYKTDENNPNNPSEFYETKWKPSIHMPKKAARIFLKVTDVRVERLQDITEEQATKEGVKAYGQNNCNGTSARIAFAELWDSISKTEFEWRTNPWVWVIEFERIS